MSVQLAVPAVVTLLSPVAFVLCPFIHQLLEGESVFFSYMGIYFSFLSAMSTQLLHRQKIRANKYIDGILNISFCVAEIRRVFSVTEKAKIYQRTIAR